MEIATAFFDFGLRVAGLVIGIGGEVSAALRSLAEDLEHVFAVEELDRG